MERVIVEKGERQGKDKVYTRAREKTTADATRVWRAKMSIRIFSSLITIT